MGKFQSNCRIFTSSPPRFVFPQDFPISVCLVGNSFTFKSRQTDTPFKMRNRRSKSGFTFTFALTIRLRFISFRLSRQSRGKLKLETKVSTNKALGGGFLWCTHLFYQWHSLPKSRILTCCSSCILRLLSRLLDEYYLWLVHIPPSHFWWPWIILQKEYLVEEQVQVGIVIWDFAADLGIFLNKLNYYPKFNCE